MAVTPLILSVWFVAALGIGAAGLLAESPVPPPAIAIGLTILILLWLRVSSAARRAAQSLGARPLVLFHLTRILAGTYFLVLYRQGGLPGEFALAAGWGDIAVGSAALVVAFTCVPVRTSNQRRGLMIWNAAGLIDILGVLANGARLFVRDPSLGVPFTILPLALLPTFVVPLVIVTHILLFGWARHERGP